MSAVVDVLPRNATGKVLKFELRDRFTEVNPAVSIRERPTPAPHAVAADAAARGGRNRRRILMGPDGTR
jgi:hypothetical protein